MICQPQRWMQTSWWNWHSRTHSLTLVLPPSFLCLMWCTSHQAAGRPQRGHPQRLSRESGRPVGVCVALPGTAGVAGGAVGAGQGQVDRAVDDAHAGPAGDGGDDERVAGSGLGAGAGEVAGFAQPGRDPGLFQRRGAGHLAELGQGDVHGDVGAGAGPVREHVGADEQLGAQLQGVVEPLPSLRVSSGPCRLPRASSTAVTAAAHSGVRLPRMHPAPPNVVPTCTYRSSNPSSPSGPGCRDRQVSIARAASDPCGMRPLAYEDCCSAREAT